MTLYELLSILITLLLHFPTVQQNAEQLYKQLKKRMLDLWTRFKND